MDVKEAIDDVIKNYPIDTTKIIREPDKPVIISNRLNVLMENEDKSIMDLAKKFKENHQCLICRQLLAQQKAAGILPDVPRETDPCGQYIRSAARLLDEYIKKKPQEFTG